MIWIRLKPITIPKSIQSPKLTKRYILLVHCSYFLTMTKLLTSRVSQSIFVTPSQETKTLCWLKLHFTVHPLLKLYSSLSFGYKLRKNLSKQLSIFLNICISCSLKSSCSIALLFVKGNVILVRKHWQE